MVESAVLAPEGGFSDRYTQVFRPFHVISHLIFGISQGFTSIYEVSHDRDGSRNSLFAFFATWGHLGPSNHLTLPYHHLGGTHIWAGRPYLGGRTAKKVWVGR